MRTLVGALALVGLLTLTGCIDSHPIPTLPPTPSATPIFASDEDALAAAEDAYGAYQALVDASLQSGSDVGLSEVATGDALEAARASVAAFSSDGRRQLGTTSVDSVAPTDLSPLTTQGGSGIAQVYACLDLSQVSVVSPDGSTTNSAISRLPTLVGLVWSGGRLLVAQEEVWDGTDFC